MPKYAFECSECALRFERNLKTGKHESFVCPSCSSLAPLVVSDFGFAFGAGKGATANSGVHDHDYPTADKAVGRSADVAWQEMRERNKVKAEARKQGGTSALIRRSGKGFVEYEPMSTWGRKAREAKTTAALTALDRQKKQ